MRTLVIDHCHFIGSTLFLTSDTGGVNVDMRIIIIGGSANILDITASLKLGRNATLLVTSGFVVTSTAGVALSLQDGAQAVLRDVLVTGSTITIQGTHEGSGTLFLIENVTLVSSLTAASNALELQNTLRGQAQLIVRRSRFTASVAVGEAARLRGVLIAMPSFGPNALLLFENNTFWARSGIEMTGSTKLLDDSSMVLRGNNFTIYGDTTFPALKVEVGAFTAVLDHDASNYYHCRSGSFLRVVVSASGSSIIPVPGALIGYGGTAYRSIFILGSALDANATGISTASPLSSVIGAFSWLHTHTALLPSPAPGAVVTLQRLQLIGKDPIEFALGHTRGFQIRLDGCANVATTAEPRLLALSALQGRDVEWTVVGCNLSFYSVRLMSDVTSTVLNGSFLTQHATLNSLLTAGNTTQDVAIAIEDTHVASGVQLASPLSSTGSAGAGSTHRGGSSNGGGLSITLLRNHFLRSSSTPALSIAGTSAWAGASFCIRIESNVFASDSAPSTVPLVSWFVRMGFGVRQQWLNNTFQAPTGRLLGLGFTWITAIGPNSSVILRNNRFIASPTVTTPSMQECVKGLFEGSVLFLDDSNRFSGACKVSLNVRVAADAVSAAAGTNRGPHYVHLHRAEGLLSFEWTREYNPDAVQPHGQNDTIMITDSTVRSSIHLVLYARCRACRVLLRNVTRPPDVPAADNELIQMQTGSSGGWSEGSRVVLDAIDFGSNNTQVRIQGPFEQGSRIALHRVAAAYVLFQGLFSAASIEISECTLSLIRPDMQWFGSTLVNVLVFDENAMELEGGTTVVIRNNTLRTILNGSASMRLMPTSFSPTSSISVIGNRHVLLVANTDPASQGEGLGAYLIDRSTPTLGFAVYVADTTAQFGMLELWENDLGPAGSLTLALGSTVTRVLIINNTFGHFIFSTGTGPPGGPSQRYASCNHPAGAPAAWGFSNLLCGPSTTVERCVDVANTSLSAPLTTPVDTLWQSLSSCACLLFPIPGDQGSGRLSVSCSAAYAEGGDGAEAYVAAVRAGVVQHLLEAVLTNESTALQCSGQLAFAAMGEAAPARPRTASVTVVTATATEAGTDTRTLVMSDSLSGGPPTATATRVSSSRSRFESVSPTASRSLDLPPCAPPRFDACRALSGGTSTVPVVASGAAVGAPPTCTVPSFRDWAMVQGSSSSNNASTAGSNQTTGVADPPVFSTSARLVGSGLVSLLFYLEADGALTPAVTPGSVASGGSFTPCGPTSAPVSTSGGPASMQLCGSGGLAVTLVAALATNTNAESDLWYAVAASDPPTAVRVEGILLATLDPANATAAAAYAHYTALGGSGSRGRVALRLNLTLRVTVRMNVSLQDEPDVGSSGRLRFTPAPAIRVEAALTAFPITVRAPQPAPSVPNTPRLLGDLYDVARSVCRASPSGLNLTSPVTAVALLAISDIPDLRLSRPALVTALAVTTTVVATVGAIVSPGIAVQQGIAQALLGLGHCGGGADQDDEDDALPVLSHPLRFGLGRGDGTAAEVWAASRRGALFSNLLLLPAAVALVAAFPASFLAMLYLRRQQAPRSPQRALITMAVARDYVGFPSAALIPVIVTSEGTASAAVGLLQRGATEGAAGDAVLGVVGLLACAGLVVAWAVVLRRVLAAPERIHLQATAYAPYFQRRRWFPPWHDSRPSSDSSRQNKDSDSDDGETNGRVWLPARLFFPWAEWEAGREAAHTPTTTLSDDASAPPTDAVQVAATARDLLRLDACIGEQWWRWAELIGLIASLVVGVCEGLDTDGNVPACRAFAVIALLASAAQGVSALTSLAPLIGAGLAVGAVATLALAADAVARSVDSPAALSPAATEQIMGVVIAVGLGALVAGAVRAAAGFFFNAALAAARDAARRSRPVLRLLQKKAPVRSPRNDRHRPLLSDSIHMGVDPFRSTTDGRWGPIASAPAPATRRAHLLATLLEARAAAVAAQDDDDSGINTGRCLLIAPPLPLRHRRESAVAARREDGDVSDASDVALKRDRGSNNSDTALKLSDVESFEMESFVDSDDDGRGGGDASASARSPQKGPREADASKIINSCRANEQPTPKGLCEGDMVKVSTTPTFATPTTVPSSRRPRPPGGVNSQSSAAAARRRDHHYEHYYDERGRLRQEHQQSFCEEDVDEGVEGPVDHAAVNLALTDLDAFIAARSGTLDADSALSA